LMAYRRVRPLSGDEERLARVLDWTGTVIALASWLRRGNDEHPPELVARRVRELSQRLTSGKGISAC